MSKTLTSRTPVAKLAAELRHLSPRVTGDIVRLRQDAYAEGAVPARLKLLTATAISVALRCEPCIRAYVEWAAREGASREELIELLNVAMAMQGCPGEEWSLKALQAWNELVEGGKGASPEGCCSIE